jgi:hypothetical protein
VVEKEELMVVMVLHHLHQQHKEKPEQVALPEHMKLKGIPVGKAGLDLMDLQELLVAIGQEEQVEKCGQTHHLVTFIPLDVHFRLHMVVVEQEEMVGLYQQKILVQ